MLSNVMEPNGARTTPPCSICGAASVMAPNAEYGVAGVSPAARRSVRTASGLYLAISPCGPCSVYSPMAIMPPDRVTGYICAAVNVNRLGAASLLVKPRSPKPAAPRRTSPCTSRCTSSKLIRFQLPRASSRPADTSSRWPALKYFSGAETNCRKASAPSSGL
ncbi:hypothetical protein D3C87_1509410 [compost metagenome]